MTAALRITAGKGSEIKCETGSTSKTKSQKAEVAPFCCDFM